MMVMATGDWKQNPRVSVGDEKVLENAGIGSCVPWAATLPASERRTRAGK